MTRPSVFSPFKDALLFFGLVSACAPTDGPKVGSQTNWFVACESSNQCGALACLCGVCTLPCSTDTSCVDAPAARCLSPQQSSAQCTDEVLSSSICFPSCTSDSCGAGRTCTAGVCVTSSDNRPPLSLDLSTRYQTLIGFGAGIAFTEDAIVRSAHSAELYDLVFSYLGLDALRIRNRYEPGAEDNLTALRQITAEAEARLGRRPVLFVSQGTPPAALKLNSSRDCGGNVDTCTLSKKSDGAFDYSGFATYWRDSLNAYTSQGITFDYLGIQNHPNVIPGSDLAGEGCRFLPEEGTDTVTLNGTETSVAFPGYRQALTAVTAALADLPNRPRVAGADVTGLSSAGSFIHALVPTGLEAISVHLYGVNRSAPDLSAFENIRALAAAQSVPVLQTEVQANALESARLLHTSLASANASAYLQNDLISLYENNANVALIRLVDDTIVTTPVFDVFAHYASRTAPGWIRVGTNPDEPELLITAWLAPNEQALTIVIFNPLEASVTRKLTLPTAFQGLGWTSTVLRSRLDGAERLASLGAVPTSGELLFPAGSLVTVAVERARR